MALVMAFVPTQSEYSQKGKTRNGGAFSIIKFAQKLSSINHDAATSLNRSPWPSQCPPRLNHQRSTATMTRKAAQVVTSPVTSPTTTPSHAGASVGNACHLAAKLNSTALNELARTDCQ